MFRSTLRRMAEASQIIIRTNPYKAQKEWPPDFAKLHPRYQFRLERKYRRRAKLRYLRPGWVKAVKIAAPTSSIRWCPFTIPPMLITHSHIVILVYGVLFMDWGEMTPNGEKPFEDVSSMIQVNYAVQRLR